MRIFGMLLRRFTLMMGSVRAQSDEEAAETVWKVDPSGTKVPEDDRNKGRGR